MRNNRYRLSDKEIQSLMVSRGVDPSTMKKTSHDVMIYDIETSRVTAKLWGTGKQYVNHKQLRSETTIISISWKWLGEDKIHALTWDKDHSDKKMMEEFLVEYNRADMIIGQNNDRFDNKLINTRAAKYGFDVNVHVKSYDILKQTRRLFRLPSYSMDYVTKFLGVTHKQSHEGIHMWDCIEDGTEAEQAEYLQKMVDYNVGDIVATEAMYYRIRKYAGHKVHFGVLEGREKFTSPTDGTDDLFLQSVSTTAGGSLQYIMKSNTDGIQFKLSHRNYLHWLDSRQDTAEI
tara:strand:+ start:2297 stop:3163 length:867 start_codon:yes stop_codon:yes gene_type:complete